MEDGLLSLKWNNHKSTFFHILSSLRKKETYTDATLACEGRFFPVHKLVMSTCSDYFCEVFERTTCKSPVVILKDIRHNDLEALLDYMYLGEVDVKQSELAGLIKAAECLRIKGLAVPDEDPSLSHKTSRVPDRRTSPLTKRSRRDSGEIESSQHYSSHAKVRRSLSPSRDSTQSHPSHTPTSVPSQSGSSDPQPQVPSHSMPPPTYLDSRSSMPEFSSSNDSHKNPDQSLVPVDMIKVEVDDEGSANSQSRQQDGLTDRGENRKESRPDGGGDAGGGGGVSMRGRDKEALTNNFSEYSNHPGEIEKEEHDQIDTYNNGSEQLPGPSGVQGGPQMMNWGEEEGSFPHNLFGGEDSSHQQVDWNGYSAKDLKLLKAKLQILAKKGVIDLQKVEAHLNPKMSKLNISFPSVEDPAFEGFEDDSVKISQLKKLLISNNQLKSQIEMDPLPNYDGAFCQLSDETTTSNCSSDGQFKNGVESNDYQHMQSFESLAQEFENELSSLSCDLFDKEKKAKTIVSAERSIGVGQKKYFCYSCSFSFKSKRVLDKHLNGSNSCTYSCPVCPYKGTNVDGHVNFHAERLGDIILCAICKVPVLSLDSLVTHLKSNHTY